MSDLTHIGDDGSARMVDVGAKEKTERRAVAEARVRMSPETARAVRDGDGPKGEVLGTARLAGIQAGKRACDLIPLAHPISLSFLDVSARIEAEEGVVVLTAEARTVDRTGVEMEAMTACSVAALTVYDMVKGLERGVSVEQVVLVSKSGGRSGGLDARQRVTIRAAVLTVSTSRAAGSGEQDLSGPALASWAESLGATVVASAVVADDRRAIAAQLSGWADSGEVDVVLTTGGTGFAPSDVTPEATREVIEREAPGIGEAMRSASREHTEYWMVSRGVAGTRGRALIVNFPGNPKSIEQAGAALTKAVAHAIGLLTGD